MPVTSDIAATDRRREWHAVLAHAPRAVLAQYAEAIAGEPFDWLREPEVGLAMLRGRIGNTGDRFNLGEATVTRCVVRHRGTSGATAGIGYVLGRDTERAAWVARFDALLQQPERHDTLMREVVAPRRDATRDARAAEAARSAASRVRFYTLTPEKV